MIVLFPIMGLLVTSMAAVIVLCPDLNPDCTSLTLFPIKNGFNCVFTIDSKTLARTGLEIGQ